MKILAIVGSIVWFAASVLLWRLHPPDLIWLAISAVMGVIFFGAFLWYLAREDKARKL